MSSNNICLCIIFLILFVHNSLWTSACKYTSYLSLFFFFFFLVFILCWNFFFVDVFFCFLFYVPSVYLTSSVPGWRTKNLTLACMLYILFFSLFLFLSPSFSAVYPPYLMLLLITLYKKKGSFVISVCIGKRKILLLRPTQWKYLSVYRLHHIVR